MRDVVGVRENQLVGYGVVTGLNGTGDDVIAAPFAAFLESRIGARALTAAGFALFAFGLGLSALQPRIADYNEMFWPQVVRGVAIMFCLLPPTRIALGALPQCEIADASGLFNLMRNLGGATLDNEENYLIKKLMTALGVVQVENQARI